MKRIIFIIFLIGSLTYIPGHWDAESSSPESKVGKQDNSLQKVRARGKLIVGVPANEPPFGFVDEKGSLKGIDIDIAKVLVKEIFGNEDEVDFIPVTFEKMLGLLKSGNIDILLSPLAINEERKKEIDFSVPYFVSGHLILVQKDSRISKYQDLAGKSVAVIQDTTGEKIIEKLVPVAKRVQFQGNSEALKALKGHKVDAFLQLDVFIFYMEGKNRNLKVLDFHPIDPSPIGLGIRKDDQELLKFVDITLLKLMATGEYHGLLEKWFGKVRAEFLELALKRELKRGDRQMK
jgi:aspartate/glutamate/glutamine transport system substrate-binding protein